MTTKVIGFDSQIGANVPAESFVMSPVDCIFVRMGARDHIMAGQSTFLTELLETALMLVMFPSHASCLLSSSLNIIKHDNCLSFYAECVLFFLFCFFFSESNFKC